jgi:iron complex outermembrane receptor protein
MFMGLELQYTGRRRTLAGAAAEAVWLSNFTLFNQKLTRGLDLSLSVYNLFNQRYGDPGSDERRQDTIERNGRSLISSYEQWRLARILENLRGASILTVGETDQFIQQGGIINLVTQENRVLFEVNLGVAEQAQLRISSKLLTLAKTVQGGARAIKN